MEGQVKFFRTENCWGVIKDPETNSEFSVHINDVIGRKHLERNEWVSFDVSSHKGRPSAVKVFPIDCPPEYLLQGVVVKWFHDDGYGFSKYEYGGHVQSVFFHANDLLQVNGVEPVVPCVGCKVSFCLGQKFDRQIAAQVWIEQWPESEPTFEEQFAAAEELPIDAPEPVAAPQSSVLSPGTRNLTLLEIRQRRKGIAK